MIARQPASIPNSGSGSPWRLFVGIACPPLPAVDAELHWLGQAALAPRSRLRVVPAANLHVTVKFLGACSADKIPAVGTVLDTLAAAAPSFTLTLEGCGSFHGALWLGVRPHPTLTDLARQANTALAALGFAVESKPFQPHLTLARLGHSPGFAVREWQQQRLGKTWGELPATQLLLFRSETLPQGARYTVVHRSPLGGIGSAGQDQ